MVKVLKGKVKFGGVFYATGNVITGLSAEDEARLVKNGFAEYVAEKAQAKKSEPKGGKKEAEQQEKVSDKKKGASIPVEESIDFNPEDCIVDEKPKSKKQPVKKTTRK